MAGFQKFSQKFLNSAEKGQLPKFCQNWKFSQKWHIFGNLAKTSKIQSKMTNFLTFGQKFENSVKMATFCKFDKNFRNSAKSS